MNVNKLRILIADDHELVRRGARGILHSQHGWRVVGEAANGHDAVEMAKKLKPDVAILEISMSGIGGVEVTRQIREAVPDTKVLVLTMHESYEMVKCALDAGALGYILKSDPSGLLVKAMKAVAEGQRCLTPKVSEIVLEGFLKTRSQRQQEVRAGSRTTRREMEVIRLLAEGKTNKEIADLLRIAVRTVETHRAHIMLKLDVHSLVELIHYAIRHGLSSVPKLR